LTKYNATKIFKELSDLKEERQKQSKRKIAFDNEQPNKKQLQTASKPLLSTDFRRIKLIL